MSVIQKEFSMKWRGKKEPGRDLETGKGGFGTG
jgi:hypothetical protein